VVITQQQLIFAAPACPPSSHCATLTELPGGGLLAAWYSGSREGAPDVAILAARYEQGRWSEPWVVQDTPGLSDGNPLLYTLPDGTVVLWHVTIQGRGWATVESYWRTSGDGGRNWTAPELFVQRRGVMFRCRPVRLSSGRLILPAYDEITWEGLPFLSDDGGRSWRAAGRMSAPGGCIQPAVVELGDGSLLSYLRTGAEGGHIWRSVSRDGGESWSACAQTALPNPNAGLDLIKLLDGRLLLAYNPVQRGRHQLAVAVSADEGGSWESVLLEDESGAEFSYPALLQEHSGRCHLLYTFRRQSIKHVVFRRTIRLGARLMSVTERFADDLTREERLRFLRHVYDNVEEQVRYSNQKANYILTCVGAVFVGCGAALLGPNVENIVAKGLLVAGLVLTSLAGASASIAIFPVMKRKPEGAPKRSLMFFGSIAQLPPGRYADIVSGLTEGEMIDELSDQIQLLSHLCQEKYRWIRLSTLALTIGLAFLFGGFTGIFLT
jgi:predicted neuraminidase